MMLVTFALGGVNAFPLGPWLIGAMLIGIPVGALMALIYTGLLAIVAIGLTMLGCRLVSWRPSRLALAMFCASLTSAFSSIPNYLFWQELIASQQAIWTIAIVILEIVFFQWQAAQVAMPELRRRRQGSPLRWPTFTVWQLLGATTAAALVFAFGKLLGPYFVPAAIGITVPVLIHLATRNLTVKLLNRYLDRRLRLDREKRQAMQQ
ncbi:MAG: hypothetical protein AAFV43_13325 [Planctomycetota bacterium]